jgi:hypothetical protein
MAEHPPNRKTTGSGCRPAGGLSRLRSKRRILVAEGLLFAQQSEQVDLENARLQLLEARVELDAVPGFLGQGGRQVDQARLALPDQRQGPPRMEVLGRPEAQRQWGRPQARRQCFPTWPQALGV